jgi:hypothetical protein
VFCSRLGRRKNVNAPIKNHVICSAFYKENGDESLCVGYITHLNS